MTNDENKKNETYRRILSAAHKLEDIQCNLESVIDFFSVPIVKLYSKLSNDCMRLLFECDFKIGYYRKAEELLWRRTYYDIYRFQKTKKQKIKRQDELLIESHFISGIGFYSTFIIKLRSHYNIDETSGLISPFNLSLGPFDNFVSDRRLNDDLSESLSCANTNSTCGVGKNVSNQDSAKSWAKLAIYRSLVYIGDLARYLLEINQHDYRKVAHEFYLSASRNQPDYGLPYNQLATLAGSQNNNLDAVCNYMRCCLKQKPFERAEGNMRTLFELNKKYHEELMKKRSIMSISEVFSSKEPILAAEGMVLAVIVNFIKLTSDLWSAISDNTTSCSLITLIAEETRTFFKDLREALELEPIVPLVHHQPLVQEFEPISDGSLSCQKPRYITPSIMYEFCSISLMLIAKLHKAQSMRDGQQKIAINELADLVNALALNLLYYSASKCQKMIIIKLQELRVNHMSQNCLDASSINERSVTLTKLSDEDINSTTLATGRKSLSRLRQREAASNYLDRSTLTMTHNDDSEMSELEETALSTIDALEISSDMSEEADRQVTDLIDLASSSGDDEIASSVVTDLLSGHSSKNMSSAVDLSRSVLRPTRSQNYEIHPRTSHLYGSTNSLPVRDLVTGDIGERLDPKAINFSRHLSNSNDGSIQGSKDRFSSSLSSENTDFSNHATREIDQVYMYVYKQTYLPTIKVFCDWLLSNGHIIGDNLSSFQGFCKELENLESLLDDLKKVAELKDISCIHGSEIMDTSNNTMTSDDDECLMQNHCFSGPTWKQIYPLSCDYPLLSLEPIQGTHKMNIDFSSRQDLSESESGFLTIQCVKAFCHALSIFMNTKELD